MGPGTGTGESNLNFNCDGFNTVNPVTNLTSVPTALAKSRESLFSKYSTCSLLEVLWTHNTLNLPSTKKPVAHWSMVLKIPRELAAENTHTDFLTNLCLENEVVVEDKHLIPLYKNAAQMMWQESPANL